MPNLSTNYSFKKPLLTESADITVLSDSIEAIDNTIKSVEDANLVQTASGTANAITLTLPTTLSNGYQVTFVASYNNSGSATTINSISVYKSASTNAPTFIKDKAYKVYYNSSNNCFFWLANAEGDALVSHVLAGKTFSNNDDIGLTGTLDLSLLISANIRSGITINGINGSSNVVDTSAGTITSAGQILSGYKCYSDGTLYTGTISSKGATTYTPSTSNQTISSGQYLSGTQTILGDSDLIPNNIISTANIFGIQGIATIASLGGAYKASGSFYRSGSSITVSLSFTPNVIITVSSTGNYVNIRQTAFSWYFTDVFFQNNTPYSYSGWQKFTSSQQSGNSGNPCIAIGTNSFTWQAIGGSNDTIYYLALKV